MTGLIVWGLVSTLLAVGLGFLGRKLWKDLRKERAAMRALKLNVSRVAESIATDREIEVAGKKFDDAVKEAKNAKQVHAIRSDLAARLDGLL